MKKKVLQAAWDKRNQIYNAGKELQLEGFALKAAAENMIKSGNKLMANANADWITAVLTVRPKAGLVWQDRPDMPSWACIVGGKDVFEPEKIR